MFMEAKRVGVAQNEIKWKPKETFRNVSVLMLCACQQAEPILMSTTPDCKGQHRITGYTPCSASPFTPVTDNPCQSEMLITTEWAQGRLQIDTRGSQWLTPAPVPGAVPENHRPQSRRMLTCQYLIPASPAAQWLPRPQGNLQKPNPKLGAGSQNQLSFC